MSFGSYLLNVAIAVDQLGNAIIGGYPDETVSSRVYRYSRTYKCANVIRIVLDLIFSPWGKEHCKESYESELERTHLFEPKGLKHIRSHRYG